jgi:hypothetical protein
VETINPDHEGPTTLDGTTPVPVCSAPAEDARKQVLVVRARNPDTRSHTVILERDVDGVKTEVDRITLLPPGVTDSSTLATRDRPIHLVGDTQSLFARMGAVADVDDVVVEVEFMGSTD